VKKLSEILFLFLLSSLSYAEVVMIGVDTNTGVIYPPIGGLTNNFNDFVKKDQLFTGAGTTGLVTSTSADTSKFLRGDGTWATVNGGGGSTGSGLSIYTQSLGSVTQVLVKVISDEQRYNRVYCKWATSTNDVAQTPAIVPHQPGGTEWYGFSDSTGCYSFVASYTDSEPQTWILAAERRGVLEFSAPITLGMFNPYPWDKQFNQLWSCYAYSQAYDSDGHIVDTGCYRTNWATNGIVSPTWWASTNARSACYEFANHVNNEPAKQVARPEWGTSLGYVTNWTLSMWVSWYTATWDKPAYGFFATIGNTNGGNAVVPFGLHYFEAPYMRLYGAVNGNWLYFGTAGWIGFYSGFLYTLTATTNRIVLYSNMTPLFTNTTVNINIINLNTNNLHIGYYTVNQNLSYTGLLDRVAFYTTTKSVSDIEDIWWNTGTNWVVSEWDYYNRGDWSNTWTHKCFHFLTHGGGGYYDAYRQNHSDMKPNGVIPIGTDRPTLINSTNGNSYLYFDGNDYVHLSYFQDYASTAGLVGKSNLTVSIWIKPTVSAGASIIDYRSKGFAIYQSATDVYCYIGSGNYGYTTDGSLSLNTWHHLVMIFDGTQVDNASRLKLYIDNAQKTLTFTGTVPTTIQDGVQPRFFLCRRADLEAGDYFYTGYLDEVRIYVGNGSQYSKDATWINSYYTWHKNTKGWFND